MVQFGVAKAKEMKAPELYRRYRPTAFKAVEGQPIEPLVHKVAAGKTPHTILLSGPSGVGKTTIARILKIKLKCSDVDYIEKNVADQTGVDYARRIVESAQAFPFDGPCRIFLLDECHKFTNAAQNCLLKILEDTPEKTYFILATTEPIKLLPTIRTRCFPVHLGPLNDEAMRRVLDRISQRANIQVAKPVLKKIIDYADGSARQAINYLDACHGLKTTEAQIKAVVALKPEGPAIEVARGLMSGRASWERIASILRDTKPADVESLRQLILAYACTILIAEKMNEGVRETAYILIDCFKESIYSTGRAGLAFECRSAWSEIRRRK